MRNKTLTKAQRAEYAKLINQRDEAMASVYRSVDNSVTPFNECYNWASDKVRAAYDKAWRALAGFESEMIAQGRAWRGSFGNFIPY